MIPRPKGLILLLHAMPLLESKWLALWRLGVRRASHEETASQGSVWLYG